MDICVEHQTYFGFSWWFNGVPRYFTFAVLRFGFSSACFCFTKLLQFLVKCSRSMSRSSFVHLVIDLVRHLNSCSGRGTLIIPEWPSASFWPFLRERSSQFKSFVVDVFVLPCNYQSTAGYFSRDCGDMVFLSGGNANSEICNIRSFHISFY